MKTVIFVFNQHFKNNAKKTYEMPLHLVIHS